MEGTIPAERTERARADAAAPIARPWTHWAWLAVFALFIATRVFTGRPFLAVDGDQCTYLEMGRTFPWHRVFAGSLYLIHPPVLGWLIGIVGTMTGLVWAGMLLNHLAWAGAFFAVRRYARLLGLGDVGIFAALLYLTVNWMASWHGIQISRYGILVFGIAAALVVFEEWLRGQRKLGWVITTNIVCLLISDQAALVLPCQVLAWGMARRWTTWRPASVVWAVSAAAVCAWPLVRLVEYRTHDTYPAGIGGLVEPVQRAGLAAIMQPNLLPGTAAHNAVNQLGQWGWGPLKRQRLIMLASVWRPGSGEEWIVALLLLLPLARRHTRGPALKLLASSLLLALPAFLGHAWYGIAWLVPGCVLIGMGVEGTLSWGSERVTKAVLLAGVIGCVVAAAVWVGFPPVTPPASTAVAWPGGRCIYAVPVVYPGERVVNEAIATLPAGGRLMSDMAPEHAWLSARSVLALPFDPADLAGQIEAYDVRYLVLTTSDPGPSGDPGLDLYRGRTIRRYVLDHPEKFPVLWRGVDDNHGVWRPQEFVVVKTERATGPGPNP